MTTTTHCILENVYFCHCFCFAPFLVATHVVGIYNVKCILCSVENDEKIEEEMFTSNVNVSGSSVFVTTAPLSPIQWMVLKRFMWPFMCDALLWMNVFLLVYNRTCRRIEFIRCAARKSKHPSRAYFWHQHSASGISWVYSPNFHHRITSGLRIWSKFYWPLYGKYYHSHLRHREYLTSPRASRIYILSDYFFIFSLSTQC